MFILYNTYIIRVLFSLDPRESNVGIISSSYSRLYWYNGITVKVYWPTDYSTNYIINRLVFDSCGSRF